MSKADILRIPDYLEHIVEAIERIQRYVAGMSRSAFLEDDRTRDAVVRNYEIMVKPPTTSSGTTRSLRRGIRKFPGN
jgi:hypothetical protein